MSYFVYILTSKSNTLYVGVTNDLYRRIEEHSLELLSGFTQKYHINKLVFYEEFGEINEAIIAEKRIKVWTRKKKINLIKTINPDFRDLAENTETSSEILH